MTLRSSWIGVFAGYLSACSGAEVAPAKQLPNQVNAARPASKPAPLAPDGDRRLSDDVVPVRYDLHLDVDPALDEFSGSVEIEVALAKPTQRIDLHASAMTIKAVSFKPKRSKEAVNARFQLGANAGLSVFLDREVRDGGTLAFEFAAPLDELPESIYRVKAGDEWYVFTQFQAQMARDAFPCFDEPKFKTPFAVAVTAPAGVTVVGNAPALATEPRARSVTGKQIITFEPTKPIPTYLVALAVGPFANSPANLDGLGSDGQALPHTVYTVRGKQDLTAYAASVTHPILKSIVDYVGSPFPYPKLDQVAVPNFQAGAMENVGLVTYRENILLLDTQLASQQDRAVARSIIAHELAHMWFGNLVTTQWWDDIWLNEAFATWMSAKVMTDVAPELETPAWAVSSMLDVMQQDALSSARPIRKTIEGSKDVQNAFDGITYQKGFAVLRMLEHWIGPRNFQRAIQSYLSRHAWGNATIGDFIAALDAETEQPIEAVARGFIEQAGVPLVKVEPRCHTVGEGKEFLEVAVEQVRYKPLGAAELPEAAANQQWSIPVCLSWVGGSGSETGACKLLTQRKEQLTFPVRRCPTAVYPNAGERGYYHMGLSSNELSDLSSRHWPKLTLEERVGLPKHALALLQSGSVDLSTYTALLRNVAKDPHRLVLDGVIVGLYQLARVARTPEDRAAVRRLASQLLQPHADRLGLTSKAKESQSDKLKRAAVFAALGDLAPDVRLKAAARKLADRFFAGADVELDQLQVLLPIAAAEGDAKFQSALLGQLKTASPGVRVVVIEALGSFNDPDLLRMSFQTLLGGVVLPTERRHLLSGASSSEDRYSIFWEWYLKNEEALVARSSKRSLPTFPNMAWMHCTPKGREQAKAQFEDSTRFGPASATIWKEVAGGIDRCIALRERFAPELVEALSGRR